MMLKIQHWSAVRCREVQNKELINLFDLY